MSGKQSVKALPLAADCGRNEALLFRVQKNRNYMNQ